MNHYCTYFDRGYLAQGLALWRSLARHDPAARLWVLALDEATAQALHGIGGDRIWVINLGDVLTADPELARVQGSRSRAEFIFALTPCLVRYLFATQREITRLVYLDADLFFFATTEPIWRELGTNAVLVVPHRYPAWHDDSARYGRFNVGVVGFTRHDSAQACIEWWRQQCLASTTLDADGTRYGDQKYLDEWPARFAGVVEMKHRGVNVAPWNWAGHRFDSDDTGVRVDGDPLTVFHFAQFRPVNGAWCDSGQLEYGIMPLGLRSRIYGPYWDALRAAEAEIRPVLPGFSIPQRGWRTSLGAWHLALLRLAWGQFWLRVGPRWIAGRLGLGRFSGHVMAAYRRWQRRPA